MTYVSFHDIPGLENGLTKIRDSMTGEHQTITIAYIYV